ncbi:hypothetical protein Cadr_000031202 [Camelus dromedarius]|uniref:Uncharacterized protein n=1 Tax=Camelus dromedarius TaxID=9838 RepID=A0A5N4BWY2_CAMDR|nr:hypothetical protein Cadr_000031202 [Camelus dromedarius]
MGRRRHGGRAIGPRLSRVTKAAGARPPRPGAGEADRVGFDLINARIPPRRGQRPPAVARTRGHETRAGARARARGEVAEGGAGHEAPPAPVTAARGADRHGPGTGTQTAPRPREGAGPPPPPPAPSRPGSDLPRVHSNPPLPRTHPAHPPPPPPHAHPPRSRRARRAGARRRTTALPARDDAPGRACGGADTVRGRGGPGKRNARGAARGTADGADGGKDGQRRTQRRARQRPTAGAPADGQRRLEAGKRERRAVEPPPGARPRTPDATPRVATRVSPPRALRTGAAPAAPSRHPLSSAPSRGPNGHPRPTPQGLRTAHPPQGSPAARAGAALPPPRRAPKQTFAPCRSTPPPPRRVRRRFTRGRLQGRDSTHNAVRPRSGPRTGGVGGGKARRGRPSVLAGQGRAGGGDEEGPLARKSDGRQGSWVWSGTNPGKGKSRDTTGPPGKPPQDPTTPTRGGGPATPRTPAGLSQPSVAPPTPRPPPPGLARSRLTPIPEGSPFHSLTLPSASRLSVHTTTTPASSGSPPASRPGKRCRRGARPVAHAPPPVLRLGTEQVGVAPRGAETGGGPSRGGPPSPSPHGTAGEAKPAHTRARSHGPAPDAGPGPAEPSPDSEGEARATAGQEQHSAPPRASAAHRQSEGPCPHAAQSLPSGGWGSGAPKAPLSIAREAFSPRRIAPHPACPVQPTEAPDVYASARLGRRGLRVPRSGPGRARACHLREETHPRPRGDGTDARPPAHHPAPPHRSHPPGANPAEGDPPACARPRQLTFRRRPRPHRGGERPRLAYRLDPSPTLKRGARRHDHRRGYPEDSLGREAMPRSPRAPEGQPGALQGHRRGQRRDRSHPTGTGRRHPPPPRPLHNAEQRKAGGLLAACKTRAPTHTRHGEPRSGRSPHPCLPPATHGRQRRGRGPQAERRRSHVRHERPRPRLAGLGPARGSMTSPHRERAMWGREAPEGRARRGQPRGPASASPGATHSSVLSEESGQRPRRGMPDTRHGAYGGGVVPATTGCRGGERTGKRPTRRHLTPPPSGHQRPEVAPRATRRAGPGGRLKCQKRSRLPGQGSRREKPRASHRPETQHSHLSAGKNAQHDGKMTAPKTGRVHDLQGGAPGPRSGHLPPALPPINGSPEALGGHLIDRGRRGGGLGGGLRRSGNGNGNGKDRGRRDQPGTPCPFLPPRGRDSGRCHRGASDERAPHEEPSRAPGPGRGSLPPPHPSRTPPCRSPSPDEVSVPPTPPNPRGQLTGRGGTPSRPPAPTGAGPPRLRIHRDSENISSKEAPPTTGNPSAPVPGLTALGPGRSSPRSIRPRDADEGLTTRRRRPGRGTLSPFPRGGKAQAVSDARVGLRGWRGTRMLVDQARPHGFPGNEIPGARDSHPPHHPAVQSAPRAGRAAAQRHGDCHRRFRQPPRVCLGPRRRAPSLPEVADAGEKRASQSGARWRPDNRRQRPGTIPTAAGRPTPRARPGLRRRRAPWRPPRSPLTLVSTHGTARHGTTRATRRDAAHATPPAPDQGGRTEGAGVLARHGRPAAAAKGTRSPAIPRAGEITRTRRRGRADAAGGPERPGRDPGFPGGGWEGEEGRGREGGGWQTETRRALREQRRNRLWSPSSSNAGGVFRKQTGKAQKLEKKGKTANPSKRKEIDLGTDRDKAQRQQRALGKRTRGRTADHNRRKERENKKMRAGPPASVNRGSVHLHRATLCMRIRVSGCACVCRCVCFDTVNVERKL